jgi:hypothetical protein
MTRDELEQKLAVLLGSRAAEDLVFARHSTVAADDLARATEIARSRVQALLRHADCTSTADEEDFTLATTTATTGTNTTRNGAPRKRAAKKTARGKTGDTSTLARLQQELPPTLRDFSRRMSRGLSDLEKRIEQEGRVARRQGARMLRQASHRLGQLEAQGEREWRKQSLRARHAAVRLLRQLERSIEPQRSAQGRKTTARRSRGETAGRAI